MEPIAPQPPQFLDVPRLLEASQPRRRAGWFWYAAGGFLLLVLISTYLSSQSPTLAAVMRLFSGLVMLMLVAGMGLLTFAAAKRQQAEVQQLVAVEELMQLRRWGEAAAILDGMLSEPTRTPQARVQALIYLSTVLARYHRFADAIAVHEHLLEHVNMDAGTAQGLRLARAMSMLREDHLVDADRAMAELRRADSERRSGGLALLEIYRDVKTGHPQEAVEIFEERLPSLREQLGHRTGDAYYLAAKAYDVLGREPEAGRAYERATLLAPLAELERRYPEAASLSEKYPPALAPAA
ncbi:MAG: hypothetical protein WBD40_17190 [Tepidisphaeraceae bacterium]